VATITLPVSTAMATQGAIGWAEKLRSLSTGFALLNVPVGSAIGMSLNGGSGEATVAAQTWLTGTRCQIVQVNIFGAPALAPLATATDYWLIQVNATTYKFASSRANAIANTALSAPTMAGGQYAITISDPSAAWPLAEIVAYELTHPLYTARYVVPVTLPAISIAGNNAYMDFLLVNLTNTNALAFTYNAIAVIQNSGAIGTATGTLLNAGRLVNGFTPYSVTLLQNETKEIIYGLGLGV
jgi:hypothetical protein